MSTELTIPERCAVALKADVRRKQFIELAAQSKEIVAITNAASYQECHSARMALARRRIEVTKEGKEVRDDAVKFQKAVIELEKELIGLIEPEEKRLDAIQTAHDNRIEAEKQAKIRAEQERIAAEQAAIKKAEEERLATERAELDRLRAQHERHVAEALKAERQAQARIEAEQKAARERIEAEQRAARERIEAEQRAAREAALKEAERLLAEQREAQRLADEAAAKVRAEQAEKDRQQREEQARIDAEKRAIEEAQRKERERREAIEKADRDAKEAAERKRRAAAEAKAKAERDAKEAKEREAARKAAERADAYGMLKMFCERHGDTPEFAPIVAAINQFVESRQEQAEVAAA